MQKTITKHYVKFISPGTFLHEETEREVESWDVDAAVKMSKEITERHGARPFAFRFVTRARGPKDFDSKQVKESGRYYLGGRVLTLDQVKQEMPQERILIENMECNGWDRIIININSYKTTQPLDKDDVVLDLAKIS